ncbi:hypothetical protein PQX77_002512 [Marasmius sp. AFHP31]|nr:hypothetical protein PQX77_002512 [Marasmius sp. AFHP31]
MFSSSTNESFQSIRFTNTRSTDTKPTDELDRGVKRGLSLLDSSTTCDINETLVDTSDVESDWFEGSTAKERSNTKAIYKHSVRRYPEPEVDRSRRENGRALFFSQRHPHLYDENGELKHELARKEGHGHRLPTVPRRKRLRSNDHGTTCRSSTSQGLSSSSSRSNQPIKREEEPTYFNEVVPDSEEE